ncbi:tyrosine-type recombinase/integrase [Halomonas halocynthiae]|uniref:tyrosine-type recombinase/integrase n=1 Tax=Halomonas halocynthiae TaxID=176290 RepID=UPI0012EC6A5C|nr:tyrosine-type recombinase/integrase [Halomonas halocynthiae]
MLFWNKSLVQNGKNKMAKNLILKGSTWHVRLVLPADVRHVFGNRSQLTKSLKTGSKGEANVRKLPFLSEWKTKIEKARNGVSATEFEEELNKQKQASETIDGIFESMMLDHIKGEKLFTKEMALHFIKLFDKDISDIFKNDPEKNKEWKKRFYEFGDRFYRFDKEKQDIELVVDFLKAVKEFSAIKTKYISKKYGYNKNQYKEIGYVFKNPRDYSLKSPFTNKRLDLFAKHQVEIKGLAQKTVDSFISKLKVLKKYLEVNDIDLSFDSYHQFLDSLDVSTKTKKNHIHAGSSFHKWASKYDKDYKNRYDTRDNPFLGHELPNDKKKGKKKEEKRLAFKAEELKKLYDFAILKRKHQVAYAIKIAGLTGCRIEEVCRLTKNHIVSENGVLSLYIDEGKTDASIRKIPIHPNLKPLVDQLVKNADSDNYLIHTPGGNKYGRRSDSVSKAFGRIKKEMGYDARHVYHSIRKTVITSLQHNDVKPLVIASIVGHETGTVTFDIYSDGASAKQKLDAINTLPAI